MKIMTTSYEATNNEYFALIDLSKREEQIIPTLLAGEWVEDIASKGNYAYELKIKAPKSEKETRFFVSIFLKPVLLEINKSIKRMDAITKAPSIR